MDGKRLEHAISLLGYILLFGTVLIIPVYISTFLLTILIGYAVGIDFSSFMPMSAFLGSYVSVTIFLNSSRGQNIVKSMKDLEAVIIPAGGFLFMAASSFVMLNLFGREVCGGGPCMNVPDFENYAYLLGIGASYVLSSLTVYPSLKRRRTSFKLLILSAHQIAIIFMYILLSGPSTWMAPLIIVGLIL